MSKDRLKAWREKHVLIADAILAVAVVAACAAIGRHFSTVSELTHILDGSRSALYTTIAAIAGSLLGFVLTAISIIAALVQSPRFAALRKSPTFPDLFKIYFRTTQVLAVTTIWSIIGLVIDTDANRLWYVTFVTAVLVALVIACVYRCIWALETLVEIAVTPLDDAQPD